MIVFTPVDLPSIEPDDWDIFWDIWNTHSKPLNKIRINNKMSDAPVGSTQVWTGLDIYKNFNNTLAWEAPFFDIKCLLPKMHSVISNIAPNVVRVRLAQSQVSVRAHTDNNLDRWHIRAFFHRPDSYKQWYFTNVGDPNGTRTYINMPQETNWFMFNDRYAWHGTDYDPNNKKILLQVFCLGEPMTDCLQQGLEKYKNYTIDF